jgi:hypothetical protein
MNTKVNILKILFLTQSLLGIQISEGCIRKIGVSCFSELIASTESEGFDSVKITLLCLKYRLVGYAEALVILFVAGPSGKL